MTSSSHSPTDILRPWLPYAAVFAAVVAVYLPSLGNQAVWDDLDLVMHNEFLRSINGVVALFTHDLWSATSKQDTSSYYRPLTMLTFALNGLLGSSAAAMRLGNVLIHALNAALFTRVVERRVGLAAAAAALPALLWALAPVSSEPVLWISGRFDLLALTFALGALVTIERLSNGRLVLAGVVCLLGAFTKESFLGWLPVLLLDAALVQRWSVRSMAKLLGAGATGAGLYLIARSQIGIPSASFLRDLGPRVLLESEAFLVAVSVWQLLVPTRLDPFRPYAPLPWPATVAILGTLFLGAVALARRSASKSKPLLPSVALVGVVWFALSTLPSSLAGPVLLMTGDRYAYHPLHGLFLSATAAVAWLASRYPLSVPLKRAALLGLALLCVAASIVNVRHFPDWHDDETLARASLRSNPGNPYALYSLGAQAAQRNELERADALLQESVQLDARSWRTWNALCFTHLRQSRLALAESECQRSLSIHGSNARTWVNLASTFTRGNRWDAALDAAQQAARVKPSYAEAHFLVALSAANLGQMPLATSHLRTGLAIDPTHDGMRSLQAQLQARGASP